MRRWSLRSRLALTAVALTALGLLAANGAGLLMFRSYLVGQVDDRLDQMTSGLGGVRPEQLMLVQRVWSELGAERVGAMDLRGFQLYLVQEGGSRRLLPPDGTVPGPELPAPGLLRDRAAQRPFTVPGTDGEGSWRVRVSGLSDGYLMVGALSSAEADRTFLRLLTIDLIVMACALAAVGLLARATVGVGLRPLSRMEDTAERIAAGDHAQRVADTDPRTEPGRLGRAVNHMLTRLEEEIGARTASEEQMRRFLADASHELRTPLTTIRGFAELARWGGSAEEALARIEAEATRMGVLVDDLLLLARLDERREVRRAPVDLLALTAELVGDLHLRHPERRVGLNGRDTGLEAVVVAGDELRLRQVVGNLLDNAVRHTPPEARIDVVVGRSTGGEAVVEVSDTGPGVAGEDAPFVFDRLYRADRARSSDGGSGLGLAIASAIVRAHGGVLELDGTPGGGATFRMVLPVPSEL